MISHLLLLHVCTLLTSDKYVNFFQGSVYQDSSYLHNNSINEYLNFKHFTILYHVSCIQQLLTWFYVVLWFLEGCLAVHLPHETKWNTNLLQLGNFIDVFLDRTVSGIYAHHQPLRRSCVRCGWCRISNEWFCAFLFSVVKLLSLFYLLYMLYYNLSRVF